MPYDWIEAHRGNIPQVNREDADQTDAERALAEERSRSLRVPGVVPGKLIGEEGAERGGLAAPDPRGMVFDHDTGGLRSVTDEDFEPPKRSRARASDDDDKPATERQQEQREQAPRRVTAERK